MARTGQNGLFYGLGDLVISSEMLFKFFAMRTDYYMPIMGFQCRKTSTYGV